MARQAANITSIDAVRELKLALAEFDEDTRDALIALGLEIRRPLEWIDHDRSQYWPREVRKASDTVSEARIALERCEVTISADDRRSCYDEKKALEKAKRRLHMAEEKVKAVRRWQPKIHKEVEEFEVQLAKLTQYLESDLVQALGVLERMSEALDRYVQRSAPASAGPEGGAVPNPPETPSGKGAP